MPHSSPNCMCQEVFKEGKSAAFWKAVAIIGDFQAAQDAVQNAGIVLFERERDGVEISERFFLGIVHRIALNARREMLRRRKIGESESNFGDDDSSVPFLDTISDAKTPHPDEEAQSNDLLAVIRRMLQWLDKYEPQCSVIMRLRYQEEYSIAETAKIVGISESKVRRRYDKALTLLRTRFRKEYDDLF